MASEKWDCRFLDLATLVASWSKDPSTMTGAVIVRPDRTVASVGYNGFPKGMADYPWRYDDRADKYDRIVHCEVNALLFAREPVKGYTLYTWPLGSCDRCAVQMIQAGIVRMVSPRIDPALVERWGPILQRARDFAEECGVEVVEL